VYHLSQKKPGILPLECFYRFVYQNKVIFSLCNTDQLVFETGPQTVLELGIELLIIAYLNDISLARSRSRVKRLIVCHVRSPVCPHVSARLLLGGFP
jgi:hypothetical protein